MAPCAFPSFRNTFLYKLDRLTDLTLSKFNSANVLTLRRQCHREMIQIWVKEGRVKR